MTRMLIPEALMAAFWISVRSGAIAFMAILTDQRDGAQVSPPRLCASAVNPKGERDAVDERNSVGFNRLTLFSSWRSPRGE